MLVNILIFYVLRGINAPTICYVLNTVSLLINVYYLVIDIMEIIDAYFADDRDE